MIDALFADWLVLAAVVFLLGLKHGLDPDHLAAIDGLTRFNAGKSPRLSRWSGLLFSAGHGLVVTLVAVTVATVALQWRAPGWLESAGTWISIGFLTLLGIANLQAVLRTPRGQVLRPAGLRSRLFARFTQASHPVLIAAVGAAFAISFDTISQAVLFSITGSKVAGWVFATLLGLVFTSGMVVTDALNGLWVSRLLARADARAASASRAMSLAIGLLALAIAATGAARQALPALDERLGDWSLALGAAVVAAVGITYWIAMRGATRPSVRSA
jgi:nickel/cobalt transporter (NiCoT) family protein